MGIPAQLVYIAVSIVLLVGCIKGANSEEVLKCTENTFYKVKKNGQAICKECPTCYGGGIGWNTTEKRLEDEHGFRSCYKCEFCKPGTYREIDSKESTCEPCSLDCNFKRRYGSVKCGGASPGHCGDCLSGFQANSKEPNSRCTLKPTEAAGKSSTSRESTTSLPRMERKREDHSATLSIASWVPGGILIILTLVVITCGVVAALCNKKSQINRAPTGEGSGSKIALLHSGSSLGEDHLEVDGDHSDHVRGECPVSVSIGQLEAMRFKESLSSDPQGGFLYRFNNRVLESCNETINVVAKNVHGERRHELFETYLKLEKSKTSPEEEKWEKGIISFADYIREVLLIWLQIADKEATLKDLCVALERASFHDIVEKVLELPENQPVFIDDLKM